MTKMLSQFLRANSISTGLVPRNSAKNSITSVSTQALWNKLKDRP